MKNSITTYGTLKSDHIIFNLIHAKNKIGRQPTLSIVLNHPSISKEHAMIEFDKDITAFIRDFKSSNGTYVNHQRIPEESMIKLKSNDLISFGKDSTVYQFSYASLNSNLNSTSNRMNSANINMSGSKSFKSMGLSNNNNNIISEDFNNTLNPKQSLYQELYKSNGDLEGRIKSKSNEITNITVLYDQLNEKHNKLSAKHNALMLYASNIQKQNDMLELSIKEKNEHIILLTSSDLGRLLNEKEEMIKLIQNENRFLTAELQKLKLSFTNESSSNQLDHIINDYLVQISNLKRIITEYEVRENQCNRKWSDLIKQNNHLKDKISNLQLSWNEEVSKHNSQILINDKRLTDALAQIPQYYDHFNANKEQAARFLINEVNQFLQEKPRLLNDNALLNKRVIDLQFENDHLKDEICKCSVKIAQMGNSNDLRAKIEELQDNLIQLKQSNIPEIKIDYEDCMRRMGVQLDAKDKLISAYKDKLDKAMSNTNIFFDEREIVNSVSQALRDKDQMIAKLKSQIIDLTWGNTSRIISHNNNMTSMKFKENCVA